MHTRAFPHPFVAAFDLPTVERPGGAGTVAADGASYREILDVADWDRSIVTNVPGQSAQPESPFYRNLLPLWADDTYFPLVYSRPRVDREAAHTLKIAASSVEPCPFCDTPRLICGAGPRRGGGPPSRRRRFGELGRSLGGGQAPRL